MSRAFLHMNRRTVVHAGLFENAYIRLEKSSNRMTLYSPMYFYFQKS